MKRNLCLLFLILSCLCVHSQDGVRQHVLTDCPTLEDVGEEADCDLFTLDGRHLGHIQGMEDLKRGGYTSGIYLLKYFVDGECVTKKIRL